MRDNRDHHDNRDHNRDHRYNERPTHEDDHGDSGDAQRSSNNSGMNNSASRPSLSPKVSIFDGTVSAQFRPWIIQFEAIARHQCWTLGERVVRLVASLGTVKTKTTPYHPRSDGLVERFNMLAMFVSREHDNWDDLLPFMVLAYNTTVHTSTGFTPYRLVFGEECSLTGNLVHR